MTDIFTKSVKQAKRVVIIVIGFTVLLIGIAMIVLPGPAIIVIPLGLAILGTEFIWARVLLKKTKAKFRDIIKAVKPDKPK
ncbi:MAG: PGPGW domain-containing protein [Planctomycetes bacterium]|nr:PGPGW domain-containing protein [Planctomycetota bacterium]